MTVCRPPAVAGAPEPRPIDSFRQVWWLARGFWHGITHGRGVERVRSTGALLGWVFAAPVLVVLYLFMVRSATRRYYMSPQRDAVLAMVATKTGWNLEDHASARPGTGQGQVLRKVVFPEILAAADRDQVAITAGAATSGLAARYMSEMPGLIDVGPARPRGRKLHRPPGPFARSVAGDVDGS